jgi:hypothetical protein
MSFNIVEDANGWPFAGDYWESQSCCGCAELFACFDIIVPQPTVR